MRIMSTVKMKPTDAGWLQIKRFIETYNMWHDKDDAMAMPEADGEGYITGVFWHLMSFFEWKYTNIGKKGPFSDMYEVTFNRRTNSFDRVCQCQR
jgi:hypothetical protein